MKLYYDTETGYLCNRYPNDIAQKEDSSYIEVEDEVAETTFCCDYGKVWAVVDGELKLIDDTKLQATDEYKRIVKENEIYILKQYLSSTDYVIAKLQEAQLEDEEEYASLKEEYAEVLTKRKEARARIRELE